MNKRIALTLAASLLLPVLAHASCDSVKSDIDGKIKAKGVSHYSLTVVASDAADSDKGKVVGTCEGDKKIIYSKDASAADDSSSSSAPAAASSS